MIVRLTDQFGRKPVVLLATAVSPIFITITIYFSTSITMIYIYVFIMGLFYSTRASGAYIMASEYMPHKYAILFGTALFTFDGSFTIFTAYFFWVVRDQSVY